MHKNSVLNVLFEGTVGLKNRRNSRCKEILLKQVVTRLSITIFVYTLNALLITVLSTLFN